METALALLDSAQARRLRERIYELLEKHRESPEAPPELPECPAGLAIAP